MWGLRFRDRDHGKDAGNYYIKTGYTLGFLSGIREIIMFSLCRDYVPSFNATVGGGNLESPAMVKLM